MLYRALIRPVMDYGAVALSSACMKHKQRLEGIQHEALRICCGVAASTSRETLQNECGELPLPLRWLSISLKEGVKIKTRPDHVAKGAMEDHWAVHGGKVKGEHCCSNGRRTSSRPSSRTVGVRKFRSRPLGGPSASKPTHHSQT